MSTSKLLTVEQLARKLHVHKQTIRRHIKAGTIKAVRLSNSRRFLIPAESVDLEQVS